MSCWDTTGIFLVEYPLSLVCVLSAISSVCGYNNCRLGFQYLNMIMSWNLHVAVLDAAYNKMCAQCVVHVPANAILLSSQKFGYGYVNTGCMCVHIGLQSTLYSTCRCVIAYQRPSLKHTLYVYCFWPCVETTDDRYCPPPSLTDSILLRWMRTQKNTMTQTRTRIPPRSHPFPLMLHPSRHDNHKRSKSACIASHYGHVFNYFRNMVVVCYLGFFGTLYNVILTPHWPCRLRVPSLRLIVHYTAT